MKYTVYVLHSEKYDKIYIGYTSNLTQRFKSHNELGTKGWTVKYRPWKIVHTEEFETKKRSEQKRKTVEVLTRSSMDSQGITFEVSQANKLSC